MTTRLLVEAVLKSPADLEWTVQGLGQLRTYLSDRVRLHVWDRSLLVPGVSPVHTHPWDFESEVIAGRMVNTRYLESEFGEPWNRIRIQCGADALAKGPVERVTLLEQEPEVYRRGATYRQLFNEIHLSTPDDGTVTIVTRTPLADPDHADVYWRGCGAWVSAEPRLATAVEVRTVIRRALGTWW